MSAINKLVEQVANIARMREEAADLLAQAQSVANTTAVKGIYSNGKVYVNGRSQNVIGASPDIILQDGCTVYCLPMENGDYVIVGSGF